MSERVEWMYDDPTEGPTIPTPSRGARTISGRMELTGPPTEAEPGESSRSAFDRLLNARTDPHREFRWTYEINPPEGDPFLKNQAPLLTISEGFRNLFGPPPDRPRWGFRIVGATWGLGLSIEWERPSRFWRPLAVAWVGPWEIGAGWSQTYFDLPGNPSRADDLIREGAERVQANAEVLGRFMDDQRRTFINRFLGRIP